MRRAVINSYDQTRPVLEHNAALWGANMRHQRTVILILFCALVPAFGQSKLTPEELVVRHLASIGDATARATTKSRAFEGIATVSMVRGGIGAIQGTAKLVTDGSKFSLKMQFNNPTYPGEDISTDGARVNIATVAPTTRSRLGYFLYTRSEVLKEGLFGGTLSSAWPLLDTNTHQPKMRYEGLKKVDGRELHDLRYQPRKGEGDLQIDVYFEPDTFRHVMTTYSFRVLGGAVTSPDRSGGQLEGQYLLRETFAQFRTENGLTLPSQWTMDLSWEGTGGWLQRWNISAERSSAAPAPVGVQSLPT